MRSQTNSNITLKYPDEIGFVFNPYIFIAEGTDITCMMITITSAAGKGASANFYSLNGKCYGDLREYIQSLYDTSKFRDVSYTTNTLSNIGSVMTIEVNVFKSDATSVHFDVDAYCIWGALKIGGQEVYNGYKRLKWFKGYPFTFGVFSTGGSLLFCRDGVPTKFYKTSYGVYNIPMLDSDTCQGYWLIKDCNAALVEVTFDSTFDLTFRYSGGGDKVDKIRIELEDGYNTGYYLRWIDRHGFYCYYLFKSGEESRKVDSDNVIMRNNLLSYDMSYGYQGYTGKQQNLNRTDTIPICAPLVDSDMYEMLFDLATSPCVDLYCGNDSAGVPQWMGVTIQSGTYKKSTDVLQDFICNLVLPEVTIQKL